MRKDLELKLAKKYPNLYQNYGASIYKSPMGWGFTCGDGWYDIIDWLSSILEVIGGIVAEQVKEKFGSLRFYYSFTNDVSEQLSSAVHHLVAEAANRSLSTCETCGKPGELKLNDIKWSKVLCDDCYEEWIKNE